MPPFIHKRDNLFLLDEYNSSSGKPYYSRCAYHGNLRLLLQVLYEKEHVPYGFTLFVDAMTTRTGYFWNRMPEERICELRSLQDGSESELDVFLEMRNALYLEHWREEYSKTSRTGIIRITNLFYLFMDMNNLCYSPLVGDAWLNSIKPFLYSSTLKAFFCISSNILVLFIDKSFISFSCNFNISSRSEFCLKASSV